MTRETEAGRGCEAGWRARPSAPAGLGPARKHRLDTGALGQGGHVRGSELSRSLTACAGDAPQRPGNLDN